MTRRVNIVYANMQCDRIEVAVPGLNADVFWTRVEQPAEVVVYHNGYSYSARRAEVNRDAFRILYLYEPPAVWPRQYLRHFWEPFDVVLTWSEALVEQGGKFVRFPSLYYDFPFGSAHGISAEPVVPCDWKTRKKAICQVAGNKYSLMPSELYSLRRSMARWFAQHGRVGLDTYGTPPMRVPGYHGRAADKQETLSRYQFALCLENDSHPQWCRGYVTEKMFDCFYSFAIPVYFGAGDIESRIPADCFIDLRKFPSWRSLDDYLYSMTDSQAEGYLRAIQRFLLGYNAPDKHSCFRLYEKALRLAEGGRLAQTQVDPFGYWQTGSFKDRLACLCMMAALPLYSRIHGSRYAGT